MNARLAIVKALKLIAIEFSDMQADADTVALWSELLGDIPDDLILAATKVALLKATFRPRIAEIRQAALALMRPDTAIDASQAWGLVLEAIRRFGLMQQEKALASLPVAVAAAVKRFGWRDLCSGEEMVNRAHFLKMFDSMQANEKQIGVLPPALQTHFRQAEIETPQPVSLAELLTPPKALKPHETSVPHPVSNVVAFKKLPPSRTPEELRAQADLLTKTARKQAV